MRRAARLRVLQRLDDEDAAPSDETKPSRFASKGRLAVCGGSLLRRERLHDLERREAELGEAGLGAAGDHHVGAAGADHLERLAHGVAGGGAGGRDRGVVALAGRSCIATCAAAMFGSIFTM